MAKMNPAFREQFTAWLKSRRLSGMGAAYRANLVVSVATINNWKRGLEPSEESVRSFFGQFEGEDVEKWVSLIGDRVEA